MVSLSRYKGTRIVGCILLASIYILFASNSTLRSVVDFPESHTMNNRKKMNYTTNNTTTNDSPSINKPSFLFSKDDADFKPTTHLSELECSSYSGQPPRKVLSFEFYDHLRNLTELTTIHGEVDTPLAICRFNEHQQEVNHFPHVIQHLYMCYSFWQDNPSKVPVLYVTSFNGKDKMFRIFRKTPFLNGFVELLTSRMEVKILTEEEIIDWLKTNTSMFEFLDTSQDTMADSVISDAFLENENDGIDYDIKTEDARDRTKDINFTFHEMEKPIGYVLSHVDRLNRMVEEHFDLSERERKSTPIYRDGSYCPAPKIGILNRKVSSGRSITNAKSLVQNITSEYFGSWNDTETSHSPPVLLTHFEGKTFQQQVKFFRGIDLLISPHGAQLTGMPFLANKPCTKLIELFPDNYLVPDYFGTLAVDSGVEYSYIYVSKSTPKMIQPDQYQSGSRIAPETSKTRGQARKQNMCVDPAVVMQALRDAIKDWCKCMVSPKGQNAEV